MHFTKYGVYWECLTNVANDTHRDGLPRIRLGMCTNDTVTELKRALLRESASDGNEVPTSWTVNLRNG
jgi:hypothetical protein